VVAWIITTIMHAIARRLSIQPIFSLKRSPDLVSY
jgi:hypothetical protein